MTDQRRENLHKYFKVIKKCIICRQSYGTDLDKEFDGKGICPICLGRITRPFYNGTETQQGGKTSS